MLDVTSSDRHHGHDANDPGDQAQAEHRDNLGGEQHLFHDDDDVLRSLLYKSTLHFELVIVNIDRDFVFNPPFIQRLVQCERIYLL